MSQAPKLSKREMLLVAITILVAFIGLFRFGYWNSRKTRVDSELKLLQVQTDLATQSTQLATLKAQRGPAGVTTTDPRVGKLLENNRSLAALVKDLSSRDRKDRLNIKRLTVDSTESMGAFQKSLYNLELSGPYVAIGRFLEALEASDLMVEIKSFEFVRDDGDLQRINGKFQLYNYVVKE